MSQSHDPFLVRKFIVALSVIPSIVAAHFLGNVFMAMTLYFGLVTLMDGFSDCILKLKGSDFADPAKTLEEQHVTPEQIDAYFETRLNIRLVSLSVAFGVGIFCFFFLTPYMFQAFCAAYILSTLSGILYVRLVSKIPRPRLIYRDDRYYRCFYHSTQKNFHNDVLLGMNGIGPYNYLKNRD